MEGCIREILKYLDANLSLFTISEPMVNWVCGDIGRYPTAQ